MGFPRKIDGVDFGALNVGRVVQLTLCVHESGAAASIPERSEISVS